MRKLKRLSIFLLLGVLTFSLFTPACGTNNHESGSTGDTDNKESVINTPTIPNKSYEGKIYTLTQAYEKSKITREYLLNIAYQAGSAEYNQEEINESFTPILHSQLTDGISLQIRSALADMYQEKYGFTDSADDFILTKFYGYYNNCVAFYYENLNTEETEVIIPYREVIDNITFVRPVYIFF